MSSSYYFWNTSASDDAAAQEEQRRIEEEGMRIAEQQRLLHEAANNPVVPLPPVTALGSPYFDNPYDNPFYNGFGEVGPQAPQYDNPFYGPLPPPTPITYGPTPDMPLLPVVTDPTIIGAIDPVTGLPYRHAPPPVPLEQKDIHPFDPFDPVSNPTIYGLGGLLGTGVDIGVPGLVSVGGLLGAGGGLLGLGGSMGGSGSPSPSPIPTGNDTLGAPVQNNTSGLVNIGQTPTPITLPPIPLIGQGGNPPPPVQTNSGNPMPPVTVPPVVPPPVTPPPVQPPPVTPPPNEQNDTLTLPPPVASPNPLVNIANPPPQTRPPITLPPIIPPPPGTVDTAPPVTVPPPLVTNPPPPPPSTPPPPMPTTTPLPLPLDRNYYREGSQTNQDMGALMPGIYGNYANYAGLYGQADQANFNALLNSLGISNNMLTGVANQQTAAGNTALRTGNVADATNLGSQALGLLQGLNPNMYGSLNAANTRAGTAGQPSDIQTTLEQQARQGLALGGGLSAEDTRNAQQAAREAWGARGLVNSRGAVAEEVLNRDSLSRQRLAERQALASAVDQQGFAQRQQGFGNLTQNALLQMQGAFNPFQTITSANTTNQGSNQQLFNQGAGFSSGAFGNQNVNSLVNPFSPYAQDVYGSNFNAGNARYISQGNNAAAMAGARDAASGDIANSFLRLIGNIYGAS